MTYSSLDAHARAVVHFLQQPGLLEIDMTDDSPGSNPVYVTAFEQLKTKCAMAAEAAASHWRAILQKEPTRKGSLPLSISPNSILPHTQRQSILLPLPTLQLPQLWETHESQDKSQRAECNVASSSKDLK